MKALIVDDSMINIKVALRMLEKLDVEADYVLSGKDCLEKIKNTKYDIIFMDIMMPEMDGVETYHKLFEIDGFNTPVVALTADVNDNAEERYLNEGFKDYIPKPINLEKLTSVVNLVRSK